MNKRKLFGITAFSVLVFCTMFIIVMTSVPKDPETPIPIVNGQPNGENDIFVNSDTIIVFSAQYKDNVKYLTNGYGEIFVRKSVVSDDLVPLGRYNWILDPTEAGFVLYLWED